MRPRGIVFDLWFTLITPEDFQQPYISTAKRIPEQFDLEPEAFLHHWNERLVDRYRNSAPIVECLADYLSGSGRIMTPADHSMFDDLWRYHDRALASPRPAVLSALRDLSAEGYRFGLLSNAHEREIREWPRSPLAEFIRQACFSCELGHVKPEPQAYAAILDRMGVRPEEAVFVGDGASEELEGARAAGIRWTVWMRGLYDVSRLSDDRARSYQLHSDAEITDIGDLPRVLAALSG